MQSKNRIPLVERVPLLIIQFQFTNEGLVPEFIPSLEPEGDITERYTKNNDTNRAGVQTIPPVERCDPTDLIEKLGSTDYRLVDSSHQERVDHKGRPFNFQLVKFVLARKDKAEPSDEFRQIRDRAREALINLGTRSFWRIKGYLNPFVEDGEILEDRWVANVSFDHRQPLFRPDGSRVREWPRDEEGEPIKKEGEKAPPIKPDFEVRVTDNWLHLTA